jgi:geranylgeranyl reductase family protein
LTRRYDVIVVGAGPAGCSAAIHCASLGYKALLLEKGGRDQRKPCAGVTPRVLAEVLECELGLELPCEVLSPPARVGLFYVPPSGRANADAVKGYELLNLDRAAFDGWLRREAERAGVEALYKTIVMGFNRRRDAIIVRAISEGHAMALEAGYLIGADGVFSTVRRRLFPHAEFETVGVLQELWEATGDFGDYFHMFFRGDVSPIYAYAVPKGDSLLIGVGAPLATLEVSLEKFKRWLADEFAFTPKSMRRRELWAVPNGTVICGRGRVMLVGDAGAFCKPFVGEGIRLSIESGAAAAEAIKRAEEAGREAASIYAELVEPLKALIRRMRELASNLTRDEAREIFVRSELMRRRV